MPEPGRYGPPPVPPPDPAPIPEPSPWPSPVPCPEPAPPPVPGPWLSAVSGAGVGFHGIPARSFGSAAAGTTGATTRGDRAPLPPRGGPWRGPAGGGGPPRGGVGPGDRGVKFFPA